MDERTYTLDYPDSVFPDMNALVLLECSLAISGLQAEVAGGPKAAVAESRFVAEQNQSPRDWHRLFGLILTDFFTDSPVVVEIERDLSQQQQFLDVLIVRRHGGEFPERLPDGLDDLAEHNLITFKSFHEPLHDFALKELAAHSVAYRKLVSQSPSDLLPEDRFKLYAVCARVQQNLTVRIPWQKRLPGVYDCTWATDVVRVIVTGELPLEEHNAPLHLFSASSETIAFGQRSYRRHSPQTSNLIGELFESLRREGFAMSYTMEDFKRDYAKNNFPGLTAEELKDIVRDLKPHELKTFMQVLPIEARMAGLPPEARVAGLPPEARMAGLPPEARMAGLPPEDRMAGLPPEARVAGLPPEDRMAGLPPESILAVLSEEQIRQYLDNLSANRKETKRKPKRKK